jgi:MSHA biogenesis protein MshN
VSLINQMLKDLDQRQAELASAEVIEIFPSQPLPKKSRYHMGLVLAPLFLLLIVSAGVYYGLSFDWTWPREASAELDQPQENLVAQQRTEEPVTSVVPLSVEEGPTVGDVSLPEAVQIEPVSNSDPEPILKADELALFSLTWRERTPARLDKPAGLPTPRPRPEPVVAAPVRSKPKAVKAASPAQQSISAQVESTPTQNIQVNPLSTLEQARRYLKQGHVSEAEGLLQRTLRANSGQNQVRELLITILQRGNRTRELEQLLGEGLKHSPDYLPFILVQSRLWLEQGESAQAEQLLGRAQKQYGTDETLLSLLSAAYQQQQRYPEALEIYQRLIQLNPESARAWVGAAIAMDATGDSNGAQQSYRKALDLQSLPQPLAIYAQQRLNTLDPNL